MNRRSWINVLFWALSFGGLVAILSGGQRAVSLRIWLAAVVIWFAGSSVRRMLEGVPLVPQRIRSLLSVRRAPAAVDVTRLRELRSLEGLLLRSQTNDRAYAQQLHPRVEVLADHFLAVTHGIDRNAQPERVHELLGPLAWLLEPGNEMRTPRLDEVDNLLKILAGTNAPTNEEAA